MPRHDEPHADENRINIGNYGPGDIALFRDIADAAAESAVNRFAVSMGLDPKSPLTSQRDFQVLRELAERGDDIRADAAWTRRWRMRSEGAVGKVLAIVLSVSVLGALGTFWTGFKAVISTPPVAH